MKTTDIDGELDYRAAELRRLDLLTALAQRSGKVIGPYVRPQNYGTNGAVVSNYNPNHDEHGRFASGEGEGEEGFLGALHTFQETMEGVEAAMHEYAESKLSQGVAKLPSWMQKGVHYTLAASRVGTKAAFITWTASQKFAERVAKERGYTPEQAKALRGLLSTLDLATFKPIALVHHGAGAAALVVPPATAAYLAYSSARSPGKVAKAAWRIVSETAGKLGLGRRLRSGADAFWRSRMGLEASKYVPRHFTPALNTADSVADALEAHHFDDWYLAILHAALDVFNTWSEAKQIADQAYEETPPKEAM